METLKAELILKFMCGSDVQKGDCKKNMYENKKNKEQQVKLLW